jgi:hypothetical protein
VTTAVVPPPLPPPRPRPRYPPLPVDILPVLALMAAIAGTFDPYNVVGSRTVVLLLVLCRSRTVDSCGSTCSVGFVKSSSMSRPSIVRDSRDAPLLQSISIDCLVVIL